MSEPEAPVTSSVTAKLDKKKSIILGVIGLAVIVLIFWKVIPQIGSYEDALIALESMGVGAIIVIGISVVIYLIAYGFPFMAATPGLRFWRSEQLNQAAFAISNGVPAGGAFGLAVQYAMLATYKIPGTVATAAITAVGLWSIFVSLGLPILGVSHFRRPAATSSTPGRRARPGDPRRRHRRLRARHALRAARHEGGHLGNRLVKPLRPRIKALGDMDLVAPITKFRADMYGLLKRRWLVITLAQLGVIMTQFLIFYVSLRGVEGWGEAGTSVLGAFGAFATAQIMLMVPITPGGLGTVDAVIISAAAERRDQRG